MKVLLLTTDAYGGHGGIALYNRDLAEALAEMPEVEEVVVIPRNMPLQSEFIPDKVRFLHGVAGSKLRYIRAAMREARQGYGLVICGHINLLPLAVLLNIHIRAPLVLMAYGIDVWKSPYTLAKHGLKKVDAVWSISAVTRDRMNAWAKLPDDKYALLPNAIHLQRYGQGEKPPALLQRYQLGDSKVIMPQRILALMTDAYGAGGGIAQ